MWLMNLRTRTKLVAAFALVLAGTAGLLYLSQVSMQGTRANNELISALHHDLVALNEVRINVHEARSGVLNALLAGDPSVASELAAHFKLTIDQDAEALRVLQSHAAIDPALQSKVGEVALLWREYIAVRDQQIMPLLASGKLAEAKALATGTQRQRVLHLRELAGQLKNQVADHVAGLELENSRLIERQLDNMRWLGSVLCLLAVALALALSHSIARPLKALIDCADQISMGNIPDRIEFSERRDELGLLSQAFARMGAYLATLAVQAERLAEGNLGAAVFVPRSDQDTLGHSFVKMVQNLSQLTLEMREGVVVLASAGEEIMTTAGRVAGGAEESATSITEIATTIEEVKQTAQLAHRRAAEVNDAADRNRQIAQAGREAVAATLDSMTQVRGQMHAMAESVLRLGEQSQAISEIVATVNELAEQSNLLGVNASIEAGKAGDAGKGFAVVALEVKALAEQSKQATAQVRTILGDVQRAMTRAAMAAEQGSKAVDLGFERTRISDDAMRTLAESMEQSGDMARQIATTSQQQVAGMDQVVMAISTLRQTSRDNAAGARQVDQSARDLAGLGGRLKQLVGHFQLSPR